MYSVLKCSNLTKSYGRFPALHSIDLDIQRGKIVGLLGPNGSGKTTLIKLAAGLLTPTSGDILVNGNKIGVQSKSEVSYLSDKL